MHTTTHMHKLTTQYATISFFYFLLHIINCHIIRISIVHDNCKQPVYTPLQQTWLNRSTYGVPFEISYRISIVHDNCKQLVYTPLQQTWLNRSTYGVSFEISYREKVQDFFFGKSNPHQWSVRWQTCSSSFVWASKYPLSHKLVAQQKPFSKYSPH